MMPWCHATLAICNIVNRWAGDPVPRCLTMQESHQSFQQCHTGTVLRVKLTPSWFSPISCKTKPGMESLRLHHSTVGWIYSVKPFEDLSQRWLMLLHTCNVYSLFEMSKFCSMHYCSQRLYNIWSLTGHARQDSSSQSLQCLHIHIQKHHLQSVTVMYVVNLAVSHFIVYQSRPFSHHTLLNPVWCENGRPWWILLAYSDNGLTSMGMAKCSLCPTLVLGEGSLAW